MFSRAHASACDSDCGGSDRGALDATGRPRRRQPSTTCAFVLPRKYGFAFICPADSMSDIGVSSLARPNATPPLDRKSTRLNSSRVATSYVVFCLKKKSYIDW